jgi:hypothetical protein
LLPSSYSCPRCECHALYRVRSRWFDWPATIFGLVPVRCWTCNRRSHLRLVMGKVDKPLGEPIAEEPIPLDSKKAA